MADKRLILAVAGSGKTTFLINQLNESERFLIVTFTNTSLELIRRRIIKKFTYLPQNIRLYTYFEFLYQFCVKPFALHEFNLKGITYSIPDDRFLPYTNVKKYLSRRYLYHNRIGKFIDYLKITTDIKSRLEKFFDHFFFDEFQDLGGHDFNFIMNLSSASVRCLFVGDFFQHTYNTSFDGKTNNSLYNNYSEYCKRILSNSITIDTESLGNSWRCSPTICSFITEHLAIPIGSHRQDVTSINQIHKKDHLLDILQDKEIIKLVYDKSSKTSFNSKNWGDCKGEDDYQDTCIILNKKTYNLYTESKLAELAPTSKNKLYVALSRTRGNCYLASSDLI